MSNEQAKMTAVEAALIYAEFIAGTRDPSLEDRDAATAYLSLAQAKGAENREERHERTALRILAAEVRRLREETEENQARIELLEMRLMDASACELDVSRAEALVPPWRPIETAPKDGTLVLVRGKNPDEVEVAEWFQWNHSSKNLGDWTRRGCDAFDFEPTHWMPLPPAPGMEGEQ